MLFDFYDRHKLVCLLALFLGLTFVATLFQGNVKAALATGLGTLGTLWYLRGKYRVETSPKASESKEL